MKKQNDISAIILAGGKSSRMEGHKALLPICGRTLIERIIGNIEHCFGEILIGTQTPKRFGFLPYQVVVDESRNAGPLMGILSCLRVSSNEINFVMACDIPEINLSFLEKMISYARQYDIVIPFSGKQKFEPLFAMYRKTCIPKIEELLKQNIRKISGLFNQCRTKYLPMGDTKWFYNLNDLEKYQQYLKIQNK
jgi:molybdopterin-guanine dinucleotide biosynthesis protein A